jgi:hypothetical protein
MQKTTDNYHLHHLLKQNKSRKKFRGHIYVYGGYTTNKSFVEKVAQRIRNLGGGAFIEESKTPAGKVYLLWQRNIDQDKYLGAVYKSI